MWTKLQFPPDGGDGWVPGPGLPPDWEGAKGVYEFLKGREISIKRIWYCKY
jgi:hypothetical protein